MSQARWPRLGWNWSICRGGGPEWLQGALPDLFSPSSRFYCALWAGTGDLSLNIGLCFPKRGSKKVSIFASG